MKKAILIIGAAALAIKAIGSKAVNTKQAYTSVTAKFKSLKRASLSTRRVKLTVDVELKNNSDRQISITQGVLSYISRIDFYTGSEYLGHAIPERQDIIIQPHGYAILSNVEVEIPLERALDILVEGSVDTRNINIKTHINIAGQTIII